MYERRTTYRSLSPMQNSDSVFNRSGSKFNKTFCLADKRLKHDVFCLFCPRFDFQDEILVEFLITLNNGILAPGNLGTWGGVWFTRVNISTICTCVLLFQLVSTFNLKDLIPSPSFRRRVRILYALGHFRNFPTNFRSS